MVVISKMRTLVNKHKRAPSSKCRLNVYYCTSQKDLLAVPNAAEFGRQAADECRVLLGSCWCEGEGTLLG